MTSLANRLAGLSPAKRALLQRVTALADGKAGELEPIAPRAADAAPPPLSFAQQRLWFLDQLEGASATYNMPVTVRLEGPLNLRALEQVFKEIVRRHESLRSNFLAENGQSRLVIHDSIDVQTRLIDISDGAPEQQEERMMALAVQEAQTPFDLARDQLLRTTLIKLNEQHHILLLTIHHIVSDGWSIGNVLLHEITTLYVDYSEGRDSTLEPLPLQYGDFALWQREWLSGARLEAQVEYWKTQLRGVPTLLELPTDHPRPAIQSFVGQTYNFSLNKNLLAALKTLSQASGTTLFMTLLAGFSALLARYSRQEDVVVGSPVANRTRKELEPLVGFFVNALVFRSTFTENMTGIELLKQIRQTCLDAYKHQDVPFERLVEAIKPERNASFSPLFQVMFILQTQNQERTGLKAGELTMTSLPMDAGTSMFDLTLKLEEQGGEIQGEFEYSTALFETATIKRFIEHYLQLLEGLVKHPEERLSSLPLMLAPERKTVLLDWNSTTCAVDAEQSICSLFEQRVQQHPNKIALRFDGQALTYAELNQQATQLAAYLRTQGATTETLVGLCLNRSSELVIGALAILKTGAAYVPLDPAYPLDRLSGMIESSGLQLILCERATIEALPKNIGQHVLIDQDKVTIAACEHRFTRQTLADSLAYVIYTSGSTGKPKGVQISHRALLNFLLTMQQKPGFSESETLLAVTTISFDIAGLELYLPLISGGTIALASRETTADGFALLKAIQSTGATVMQATPATWRMLMLTGTKQPELKRIFCGGEALDGELASQLLQTGAEVWNLYGPTETTIWSTASQVIATQSDDSRKKSGAPIGTPIGNTQTYILDDSLEPCALGVPGELYIGGMGVSRGYLGQPGMTAERFIPDPFSLSAGARLYRTGDLVRYQNDGQISYIGRVDFQVKVRGFRIELGEIEATLNGHPEVQNAVAVVRMDRPEQPQIVAYVQTAADPAQNDQQASLIARLRTLLQSQLPAYMMPTTIMCLSSMPMTPNGKIDRKALPSPDFTQQQEEYVAPNTDIERECCAIWSLLLGIPQIGIRDNFFTLGGHSILAVQLISKLRDALHVELAIHTLFDCPTIEQLAQKIATLTGSATTGQQAPTISRLTEQDKQHSALAFAQQRLWFLSQLEGQNATYLISGAVQMTGELAVDVLEPVFTELVRRHEALRTTFIEINGNPVARLLPQKDFKITQISFEQLKDTEQESAIQDLIQQETNRPFDLTRDVLLRVLLIRKSATSHVMIMTLHHIISDEWSMAMLQHEVVQLYHAYLNEQPSPLVELTLQYSDYANWQRNWLTRERLADQMAYWVAQLKGAPALLELPTDHARPTIASHLGKTFSFNIASSLMDGVRGLTQAAGATLFMTLLTAWSTLLGRHAGTTDLVIGSPMSSRNRSELESLIGFFVNTLPLRIDLSGQANSLTLIQRIKKTVLGAFAHQELPFDHLVEELKPERNLSYTPVFQAMFVMQNAPTAELTFDDLTLEMITTETLVSKFDLTLSVEDKQGTLHGVIEYSTDLFEQETIERLATQFEQLLIGMCAQPEQQVLSLPLLTAEQSRALTAMANPWPQESLASESVLDVFAAIVATHPEQRALLYAEQALSFSELNQAANRLAHQLRRAGAHSNTVVGLYAEPSLEMIVGLLGILKAGAAYLPLLPGTPLERIKSMCAETGARWVLDTTQTLNPWETCDLWPLELATLRQADVSSSDPVFGIEPASIAYVIYTSGSTGQPKGVMVSHANLLNSTRARLTYYQRPLSGLILLQPFSFDVASGNIFWTLCAGGTLFLEPRQLAQDPQQLLLRLEKTQASHLVLLPLLYSPLLELAGHAELKHVNTVIVGGEKMPADLVTQHHARASHAALYNEYGPTETTVMCCAYPASAPTTSDRPIPIGKALMPSQLYLLDTYLNPVPIGVAAELYIGGPQVSLGYQGHPGLSAEKFLPDPFTRQPGARMYRSGDIARRRVDGNIEFVGRDDQQVKIRGFRVELGEIEANIKNDPAITEVAVVAHEQGSSKRLIAYLVLTGEGQPYSEAALRERLESKLPAYMVPSAFMLLQALPLTNNGKLDHRALPLPANEDSTTQYVAPSTELEQHLAQIWREVLGLQIIGIDDNFFMLGGDSILSIQIISRATRLGIGLSVKQLFLHQSIRKLAAVASSVQQQQADQNPYVGSFELTPIQHWFFENDPANVNHFNQSLMLRIDSATSDEHLLLSLEALQRHHDMLRARFHCLGSVWQAAIHEHEQNAPFSSLDLSHIQESERHSAIESVANATQQSLDIESGPLWKVVRIKDTHKREDRLLWVIHHLAVDGISWRVLLEDLEMALKQLSQGQEICLPLKTSSLPLWSERLNQYVNSPDMADDMTYWRTQIERPRPTLPKDFLDASARDNTLDSLRTITKILPAALSDALLTRIPGVYQAQINDLLLAALLMTFKQWTTSNALRLTLEGHGREDLFDDVDLSRTVGWFTSGFPVSLHSLALDRIDSRDLAAVVRDVKDTLRSIPQHGVGFGILRYLHPEASVRNALVSGGHAEVSFNYLGQFKEPDASQFILGEAPDSSGSDQSREGRRQAVIEINSIHRRGELEVSWSYSDKLHRAETIEALAQQYIDALVELVHYGENSQDFKPSYAVSDFLLAKLTRESLDTLAQEVSKPILDIYPLSPMQQGMLFHSQLNSNSGDYIIQLASRMQGNFEPEFFEEAWQALLARHDSLRACIVTLPGAEPLQVIVQSARLPWNSLDWRSHTAEQQQQQWTDLIAEDRQTDFAPEQAPMMRCTVARTGDNTWNFLWSHHHLLTDGWCLPILMREVLELYQAKIERRSVNLPLARPYREYIAWLSTRSLEQAQTFWSEYLEGFDTPTQLGLEAPISVARADSPEPLSYASHTFALDNKTSQSLRTLAQQQGLTLSVLIQGAWAMLLSRYSASNDVLFGATVSGRPPKLVDVDQMVGLFINTLPVRVSVKPQQAVLDYFQTLRDSQLTRDEYAYTPLVEIHRCSEVPTRQALFDSIVIFENYPVDQALDQQAEVLQIDQIQVLEQISSPLTLMASPGDSIPLKLFWDTSRFDGVAMNRLCEHLSNLLAAIPKCSLGTLAQWQEALLGQDERKQLSYNLNPPPLHNADHAVAFSELFSRQVTRTPEAPAVSFHGETLSYEALNRRANQIAARLLELGATQGVFVSLYLERSADMLAALLAVQKTGAAYIPLDPAYPSDRIQYMLEDSQAQLIVTQASLQTALPDTRANVVILEDIFNDSRLGQECPQRAVSPDDLAYVIYTSGSTGKPKGVALTHRNLTNFLLSMAKTPGLSRSDTLLAVTTISFDIAGLELYLPLLVGAQVVIADRETAMDGVLLKQSIDRHGVTVMQATPTTWRLLLEAGWSGNTPLKRAFCGGEGFPSDLAQQMVGLKLEVWNLYGPTETTIWSTAQRVAASAVTKPNEDIGYPIDNTTVYVVDQDCNLMPQRASGELLIGGDGLAWGYLGLPALTAEKFIPDPFGTTPGARLYKTGDRARQLADGTLTCLGRIDHQIKIRGYRIEPGEIEVVIQQHPLVRQAVVIVWTAAPGDKRLAAYFTSKDQTTAIDAVKDWTRSQLPAHMVPTEWAQLEQLPLTPNGKLDRNALPAPGATNLERYVAPASETEVALANLMAEVLGIERVSCDDDFFDLGGHSLLAGRLVTKIQQILQIQIPLTVLFDKPCVNVLAEHIDTQRWLVQQQAQPLEALTDDEEEFRL